MVAVDDVTKRCLAGSLIALVCVSALRAQAKPDFSGTWVQVTPDPAAAERQLQRTEELFSRGLASQAAVQSARAMVAPILVVTQTTTTITARQGSPDAGQVTMYNLDGSESRNAISAGGAVTVARPAWEGDRLVIAETTTYADGKTVQGKRVWSFDQQRQLVVETSGTTSTQVAVYGRQ